jgi:hypothetical protein
MKSSVFFLVAFKLLLFTGSDALGQVAREEAKVERWTPFQLAFFEPVQMFPKETNVAGLRLDLVYGENNKVWGVGFGLWNISEEFRGIEAGVANSSGDTYGIQVGFSNSARNDAVALQWGILNAAGENFVGIQVGALNDTSSIVYGANEVSGIQVGILNASILPFAPWAPKEDDAMGRTSFSGIEIGAINAKQEVCGLSVGLINASRSTTGVQVGAVNYAAELKGLQLGLLNFNDSGALAFFPVMNASW